MAKVRGEQYIPYVMLSRLNPRPQRVAPGWRPPSAWISATATSSNCGFAAAPSKRPFVSCPDTPLSSPDVAEPLRAELPHEADLGARVEPIHSPLPASSSLPV